jgi:hypothetical protein
MSEKDPRPLLVMTVLIDGSARPAAITRSHGDAMERVITASAGHDIAGMEIAELAIAPKAFASLRRNLGLPEDTVALYDIFPLASDLPAQLRGVAGQFLAAEALWTLEEQGMTSGVPPQEKLDLPDGWSRDPKDIRQRLIEAGASALSDSAAHAYLEIKKRWDGASV